MHLHFWIRRLLCIVVMLLAVVVPCASANDYFTIEPGWRVGPLLLNMTKEDIIMVYGEGEFYVVPDPERAAKMEMLQYRQLGIDIVFKNHRIDFIDVKSSNYTIKDMIRVGCSIDKVKETLGNVYIHENYRHSYEPDIPDYMMKYKGITFHVKGDRVVKITVTRTN